MSAALVWAERALPVATTLPVQIGWTAALVLAEALVYTIVVACAWSIRRDGGSAEAWLLRQLTQLQRDKRRSASTTG